VRADRADIERAIAVMKERVKVGAADPENPWAMAHGLLAFGPEMKASDGRLAIDVMVDDYAESHPNADKELLRFPEKTRQGLPVEPHRHLMVKSLLEALVPSARKFTLKSGAVVTMAKLADDMEASIEEPSDDEEWHNFPWSLSMLLSQRPPKNDEVKALHGALRLSVLVDKTLLYLEAQQGFIGELMDQHRPDALQKQKQLIYSHTCGGLHLIQAAVKGALYTKDPRQLKRAERQLEILLFRWQAERKIYEKALNGSPEYRILLLTQELKFYGHALETFALARRWGAFRNDPDTRDKMALLAGDLIRIIDSLDVDYEHLDDIRRAREQTYFDLIGDGCHAVRGLRESLVAFFRP
jgi:hypothetical protein